ncbi:MAG: lysophospholipase [Saprospiraceae bacterium]
MTTSNFQSNGLQHFSVQWNCESPKAVVLIVHGLGEHVLRYKHVADFFNKNNISVVGFDHSGHGQTKGKRGFAKSMESLMDGVRVLLENTKQQYPKLPVFLYGHSMGGNISLNFILRRKPEITGAIITGPHIRMVTEPSPLLVMMGRLVNNIYPSGTQNNGLDPTHICRDQAVVDTYNNDPLVHDQISYSLAVALIDGAKWLDNYKGATPSPLLLMHGGADKITSPKGTQAFAKRIISDVTHKEWENHYHEIHNEEEQQKVFTFTLRWIENYL